jgi:hypothetical protein
MAGHVYFEELCAAASIGQATGEELLELEQHAAHCDVCRRAYFDYLSVAAQQFATAGQDPTISPQELQECIDSQLLTRRFLDRAEREGILFSRDVDKAVELPPPIPFSFSRKIWWRAPMLATAVLAVIAFVIGDLYWRNSSRRPATSSEYKLEPRTVANQRTLDLAPANLKLQSEVDRLQNELRKNNDQLVAAQTDLQLTSQERRRLQGERDALQMRLLHVEQELARSEITLADERKLAAAQRDRTNEIEAALVSDQMKLHDTQEELVAKSATLEQEHQLLSLGHDVTDLMGARNLHIVDVADTDPRGKTRPAFGRVFFTEGKSLIFYAYDLNEAKIEKANYQYQVWARKEGQNRQAQRLGIFYIDDKSQRRWVFKCDDPKVLRDIDSVFVTFGRSNSDPSHPEGSSLMYAYLRGQPNHP